MQLATNISTDSRSPTNTTSITRLLRNRTSRFGRTVLVKFYKQPRPVSTLLKGLIRWFVHIHYNPKAITKTEYSTLILNKREPVLRCMTANKTSSHDRFSLI